MANSDSLGSWLKPDAADWISIGFSVLAAIITKGASASGVVTEASEAADNAANVYLGAKGATPGIVVGGAKGKGDRFVFREAYHRK